MLTDTQADISYEKALDALDLLIDDEGIDAKERAAAERKRKRLTLVYIGKAIQDIEARTAKFQAFIAEMQDLIDKFDPATKIAGIAKLTKVVQEAGQLVEVATEAIAAVPKGKAVPKRAAPRGAAKATARVTVKAVGASKAPSRAKATTAVAVAKTPARAKAAKVGAAPPAKRAGIKRRPAAPTRAGKARPTRS